MTILRRSQRAGRPGKPGVLFGQWAFGPEGRVTPKIAAEENQIIDDLEAQHRAESKVAYDDLIKRAPDTCVNLQGRAYGIGAITPPVVVVTYTVPEAYIFRLLSVGFMFNDPLFQNLDPALRLPWRIEVNDIAAPVVGETGGAFAIAPGTVFDPFILNKFWVQGGQTVRVVVRPFTITIHVNAVCRIQGELYKAVGLKLGERV